MDIKNLLQRISDVRNPSRITLGLCPEINDTSLSSHYSPGREVDPALATPISTCMDFSFDDHHGITLHKHACIS